MAEMHQRIEELKLYKRLSLSIEQSSYILTHFDQAVKPDVITFFSLCMLDRLKSASKALRKLAASYPEEPEVEYSAGIIIRAVILDFVIVLNAFAKFDDSNNNNELTEKIRHFCISAINDSVQHALKSIKSMKDNVPEEIYLRMLYNLVHGNPYSFEKYDFGTEPVFVPCDKLSTRGLIKTIKKSKLLEEVPDISYIYDYYSKYDHFGGIYYSLTRQEEKRKLCFVHRAIALFPKHLECSLSLLRIANPENRFLEAIYKNSIMRRTQIDRGHTVAK